MSNAIGQILEAIKQLFTWWFVVAPWERALRVRMGKHIKELDAGIYMRIPFIDRIYCQSIRKRVCRVESQTVTTSDGQTVIVAGNLEYSIGDLRLLYDTLHHAQDSLVAMASAAIAQSVSEMSADSFLEPRRLNCIASDRINLEQYGILGSKIQITDFCKVRAYRFVTGAGSTGAWGDVLNTVNHAHLR